MNTANLQLEGLLLAFASILDLMTRRGIVSREELIEALTAAEAMAAESRNDLRQANVEAIRFPIRYLTEAIKDGQTDFATVAARVGEALDEERERS